MIPGSPVEERSFEERREIAALSAGDDKRQSPGRAF
jgi:hypothetical protein